MNIRRWLHVVVAVKAVVLLVLGVSLATSAIPLFESGRGVLAVLLVGQACLIALWFVLGGPRRAR